MTIKISQSKKNQFWRYVEIVGEEDCWLWKKALFQNGYGQFWDGVKNQRAHRFAYTVSKGEIPSDMLVLHSCDVRACCNPRHLFLGTHADNMKDMTNKGRSHKHNGSRAGAANPNAKMSRQKFQEIQQAITQGGSNRSIAAQFGVSHATVSLIRRNEHFMNSFISHD